jgi:hypothetical protein
MSMTTEQIKEILVTAVQVFGAWPISTLSS